MASILSMAIAPVAMAAAAPHATAPSLQESGEGEEKDFIATGDEENPASLPVNTISETTLTSSPVEGFGTLDQSKDGLPADIWKGSQREAMDAYLKELHGGVPNPELQNLLVRLLMTQATPPLGNGTQSWFAARIYALIALGQDEKAEAMLSSLPASMMGASLRKIQAELRLLRGEAEPVCRDLQPEGFPADEGEEAFWPKLGILCKARAGKQDEALLGVDLMREQQHVDDAFFQEAIRKIGDKNAIIKSSPRKWSPLNVALLRLAGENDRIKDRMDAFPPIALKYLAQDASLDAKLREKANARAQQLALLPENAGNKTPEPPFSKSLASDVTALVAALGSGKPANAADNAVIARLALSDASISDSRRVQRLLSVMEPFGYHVPAEVRHTLLQHRERLDGEIPPAAFIARMQDAARASRRGETVVLASVITTATDPARITDLALLPAIRSLQAAGFEKEARALAHDAVKNYSGR